MSKQKRFGELKEHFRSQVLIGDRKFQDFYGLLGQAQHYAGKPQLRLIPCQMDELHAIYKEHKLSILAEIIGRFGSDTPPYPLDVMKKAIAMELELWPGATAITQEQFRRVYAAAMDAELKQTQQAVTSAARNELSKILSDMR